MCPRERHIAELLLSKLASYRRGIDPLRDGHDEGLREIELRIEGLAQVVLRRRLGVERFMVLNVERADGYCKRLQIDRLAFAEWRHHYLQWAWHVSGRSIRKDGKLGSRSESMTFREAKVARRSLTGEWIAVKPTVRCLRRRNETGTW